MSEHSDNPRASETSGPCAASDDSTGALRASATAEPGAHLTLTGGDPVSGAASATGASRPRRGRVAVEFAECSLGEILNVSPTGLRARYKGSKRNLPLVDERFSMHVRTPDGPVAVRARVAWTKRVGFRKFDIGVEFIAADEKDSAKLKQLASMAGRSIVINEATGGAKLRAG